MVEPAFTMPELDQFRHQGLAMAIYHVRFAANALQHGAYCRVLPHTNPFLGFVTGLLQNACQSLKP